MKSKNKVDCALETKPANWKTINWKQVERSVKSFQLRIAKATREDKHNKVRALQKSTLSVMPTISS